MSVARELAIVVGATGALGRVICRRLTETGLQVMAVARSPEALSQLATELPTILPCAVDISRDAAISDLGARIGGPVRMIVHGPGVATAGGVLDVPTAALTAAVDIKVGGLLRLVRAADEHLVRGSRIVAIGGHYGFEPTAYAATAGLANAALANVVRQLSWAYGARGVTAHLVAPGPADTDRLRRVAAARAGLDGVAVDEVLAQMRGESALGTFTSPEQVAWAIALLKDPQADALAGSTLFMDAGRRRGLP